MLDDLARQLATPLPEPMVRSRMSEMTRNLIDGLASRGVTAEQYLQLTGQTSEQLVDERSGRRPRTPLAKDLALEAVADAEGDRGHRRADRELDPRAGGRSRGGRRHAPSNG